MKVRTVLFLIFFLTYTCSLFDSVVEITKIQISKRLKEIQEAARAHPPGAKRKIFGKETLSIGDRKFILKKYNRFYERFMTLSRSLYMGNDLIELLKNIRKKILTESPADYRYPDNIVCQRFSIGCFVRSCTKFPNILTNICVYLTMCLNGLYFDAVSIGCLKMTEKSIFRMILHMARHLNGERNSVDLIQKKLYEQVSWFFLTLCFDDSISGNLIHHTTQNDPTLMMLTSLFECSPDPVNMHLLSSPYDELSNSFYLFHTSNCEFEDGTFKLKRSVIDLFDRLPMYIFLKVPNRYDVDLEKILDIKTRKAKYKLTNILLPNGQSIAPINSKNRTENVFVTRLGNYMDRSCHFTAYPYTICVFGLWLS